MSNNHSEKNDNPRIMWTLYTVVFMMSVGFYVLYPLLANHLITWKKIAVFTVTIILNLRIFVQDALMFSTSVLLKTIAPHVAVAIGGIIRGAGFLIFAATDNLFLLVIAGIFTGIGGALFFPSMYSLFTHFSDKNNRLIIFGKRERLNSLGAVVGPLIGLGLARISFLLVGVVSAVIFFASSIYLMMVMPKYTIKSSETKDSSNVKLLSLVLKDKGFLLLAFALMLVVQIHNQMNIGIALRVDQIKPSYQYVGMFSSVSSIVMVAFQVLALKFMSKNFPSTKGLTISVGSLIMGFLIMGFLKSVAAIYIGTIFISVGAMIHFPMRDDMISKYSEEYHTSYYSFISVLNTMGTIILASAFGKLCDLSYQPKYSAYPWLAIAVFGVFAMIIIWRFKLTPGKTIY